MRIGLLIILFFIPPLLISAQPEKYTRIEIPCSLENIEEVYRLGINIAFIEPDDYLWFEVSEGEFALLKTTGIDYRILIEDISEFYRSRNSNKDYKALFEAQKQSGRYSVPSGFTFGSMGGFSTYLEILGHLDNMFELYPGLITQPQPISEDTTTEGRHLYWQRISNNPTVTQEKPRVLYTALTHAREPASVQQLLYFMYYILENYGVDDEITDIVDNTELYFVPCVNPDGYVYNQMESPQGGGMWRKNRRNNGDGSFGVDLNRNFGYKWGYDGMGSSPIPSSNTFRGNAPLSTTYITFMVAMGTSLSDRAWGRDSAVYRVQGVFSVIGYIDPTGMLEDDYGLDKQGNITLLRKTDDPTDKLIALDNDGNETDKSIEVDKGILSSKKTNTVNASNGNDYTFDQYKIKRDDKAKGLFEFVADNTEVEWSLTGVGAKSGTDGQNILTTSHIKDAEIGGGYLKAYGYTIRKHSHSHPYNKFPSAADKKFAESLNLKFPKATLDIYHKGEYFQYAKNGLISVPTIVLPEIEIKVPKN
jgi:hypothetical protein